MNYKKMSINIEKYLVIFSIISIIMLIISASSYKYSPVDNSVISMNDGWSVAYDDVMSNKLISLPYKSSDVKANTIDLYHILPEKTHTIEALALTVYQKSVWIYIDRELVYEHVFIPSMLNKNSPGTGNATVTLPPDSAGKELRIRYRIEAECDNSFIVPPRIVNGSITQTVFSGGNIIIFACMVSFLFVALLFFVMFVIKFHSANNNMANISLALIFASIATWVLCYNKLTDVFTQNWSLVHVFEYITLYVLPFAIWNYIYRGWSLNSRFVKTMRNFMGMFFVLSLALNIFFAIDFSYFLTIFHLLVVINIFLLAWEFSRSFKTKQASYKLFAIGMFIILSSALLALFQQYFLKGELSLSIIFVSMTAIAGVLMTISVFCLANESLSDKFSNSFMQNLMYEHGRYEAFIRNTGDVFFDWDTKNDNLYISSNFENYFGVAPEAGSLLNFFSTGVNNLLLPNDFDNIIKTLMHNSEAKHIEGSFTHSDGSDKWFTMDLTTNIDPHGAPTHIIGIIHDTTNQKQLESKYTAQMQYNFITKKMYENVLEADLTTNIVLGESMDILCKTLGIDVNSTYDELINAISINLTHPDYADEYAEFLSSKRILSLFENGITSFEFVTYEADFNGIYQWLQLDVQIYLSDITDTVRIVSYVSNISAEKERELSLMDASLKDALTGILNKGALRVASERFIDDADKNETYALFMIDIDYFKNINDTFGHLAGDTAITHVADIIKSHFRPDDFIGRFGGDEFVALITNPVDMKNITQKCEELTNAIRTPLTFKHNSMNLSLSIGVAVFPNHGIDYKTLCDKADKALYTSKAKGRDTYTIYSE